MKVFIIILYIITICYAGSNEPMKPDWITAMDFDKTNPPDSSWPECGVSTSWDGWNVMNWDCDNLEYFNPAPGITALSTNVKFSGTRSLMMGKQAGCHAATQIWYDWSNTHPNVTTLYVRMYIFFDSSWSNVGEGSSTDNYWHLLLLNAGAWTPGVDIYDLTDEKPWNITCYKESPNGGQYLAYRHMYSNNSDLFQIGPSTSNECWDIKEHLNEWHCHEWMFKRLEATQYQYKHWVDQVVHADRIISNENIKQISEWINLHIDQWLSTGDGLGHEVKTYIDNIVISKSYIGPMGIPKDPNIKGLFPLDN